MSRSTVIYNDTRKYFFAEHLIDLSITCKYTQHNVSVKVKIKDNKTTTTSVYKVKVKQRSQFTNAKIKYRSLTLNGVTIRV